MKKRKVKIVAMPKAANGANISMGNSTFFNPNYMNVYTNVDNFSAPATVAKRTISGDPNPNIEAEGGETIVDDRDKDGIAEHYNISGPRHTNGGVDINAGENAFVFSDTKAMKIGGDILKAFGKSGKKKLTPADIAKQYDINSFLAILKDPDADDLQIETAKTMINNYNNKLGALALVQESKKGFEAGVPAISYQYLQSIGVDPMSITPDFGPEEPEGNMARYGGSFNLPIAQNGNLGQDQLAELYRQKQKKVEEQKIFDYFLEKQQNKDSYWAKYKANKEALKKQEQIQELPKTEEKIKEAERLLVEALKRDPSKALSGKGKMPSLGGPNIFDLFFPSKEEEDRNTEREIEMYTAALNSLKKQKEKQLEIKLGEQEKRKPTYKSYEEYQAHLLDPYSPEKKEAQRHFIATHPELFNKKVTAPVKTADLNVNIIPATGVTADSTFTMPAKDTTLLNEEAWNNLSKAEKARLKKTYGAENIFFEQRYGGELPIAQYGNKGKKKSLADVESKGSNKSTSNQGNWQKEPLIPYGMNEAYGPKGAQLLSAYLPEYGLSLPEGASEQDIRNLVDQMQQKAISTNPELVKDYLLNRSHQPNKALLDKLPAGYKSQEGLKKAIAEGKISNDDLLNSYNDKQWWYRALGTKGHELTKEEYEKQMAKPGAVKQGDKLYWNNPETPWRYDYYTMKEEQAPAATQTKETPQVEYKPGINHIAPERKREIPNEYWLQDAIRQRGNARDYLTLKKYMPWQATPDVHLAEGVFEDPNRGIAAMQENINAQNQMMGTFAGPQGLARSQASAKGVGAMADYISGVANRNIDRANQMELYNTGVLNQGAMTRAGLATDLYDKNTIANQQFDNSRRKILHNMDDTQIAAETNRAYTYNMNQINPHFNINPSLGGDMYFTGNTDPLSLAYEDPDAWLNQYAHYRKIMPASVTDDALIKLLSENKRKASANPYADIVNSGMYPGMT